MAFNLFSPITSAPQILFPLKGLELTNRENASFSKVILNIMTLVVPTWNSVDASWTFPQEIPLPEEFYELKFSRFRGSIREFFFFKLIFNYSDHGDRIPKVENRWIVVLIILRLDKGILIRENILYLRDYIWFIPSCRWDERFRRLLTILANATFVPLLFGYHICVHDQSYD